MQTWAMQLLLGLCLVVAPTAADADDVDTILKRWSEHISKHPLKGLHGTARLYVYDETFQTESRGRMEFWISGPEEWRVDFAPAEVGVEQLAPLDRTLTVRSLQRHYRWSQSSTELTQAVGGARGIPDIWPCEVPKVPRGLLRGEDKLPAAFLAGLAEIPSQVSETLPGLIQLGCFGLSRDPDSFYFRHPENWVITLQSADGVRDRIHLRFRPRSQSLKRSLSSVEVMLTGSDFTPIGVRVCDPAQTMSTTYAFEGVGDLPYNDDPFGADSLARWPPECRTRSHVPPPPPVATRLAD